MRVIIFYRVSDYNRDEFDGMKGKDIVNKVDADDNDLHVYCLEKENPEQLPDLTDLEMDYNDEELDGGWWCQIAEY